MSGTLFAKIVRREVPRGCELSEVPPSPQEYCTLRQAAGMPPRSVEAAEAGLPNSWYAVSVRRDGRLIGMGRVIGDGGCFFQIVDIAVDPAHQGRGLRKTIMGRLMDRLHALAPPNALVSLLADGEAHRLYTRFGFQFSAPASVGMIQKLNRRES
jgi:GNAT superfamily N-acetyltransferase